MKISLKIDYKILIFIGLSILWQSGFKVSAQSSAPVQDDTGLTSSFIKPEIYQKAGQVCFNIIKIRNLSDTAIRFKPLVNLPAGFIPFSAPFRDTIVQAHDSLTLPFRFQLPIQVNAEIKHEITFRAYSMHNKLLSENKCIVIPEVFHSWDVILPDKRIFFYPRMNLAEFDIHLQNKGNTTENIKLTIEPDNKIELKNLGDWKSGENIVLNPYQDTIIKFDVRYTFSERRVFDISKIQIHALANNEDKPSALMIEKYNDTYAPFYADRTLPHQVEVGMRTFSGNKDFLPFIKARGTATFKNESTLLYNFNYYSMTGNEDFISNTYYNFLYSWKMLKVGLGAFSSQLGRNLYTRHGIMVSNTTKLSPMFSIEAFISQSFFTPKTSAAVGYTIGKDKIKFHGSVAYDMDGEKKVNTGSVMLQSNLITLFKGNDITVNLYGYNEYHYLTKDYTMTGLAWDINYYGRIGNVFAFQIVNNYGSPNIPGSQMGLLNLAANTTFLVGDKKQFFTIQYVNSSRKYHSYSFEGDKQPDAKLYDQYASVFYHARRRPNNMWDAGPSVELYHSFRPSLNTEGVIAEYTSQKLRFEYKATLFKSLSLNVKTGVSNNTFIETTEIRQQKFDFHVLGGVSFKKGYGIAFSYDYGPMVNSGLYQFAGDAENHSFSIGPSLMTTYFNERVSFNLFSSFSYRFDLQYTALNVNPKIEAYLFRDWYLIASGTYHYTQQDYPDFQAKSNYTYFELSLKKRWGKSDFNKWQKDTRRLKVVLFKDDNGNGVKEDSEEGVPFVKTRLKLTNSDNPNVSTQFPVDIILLSNDAGIVNYNRIPKGFYELTITPLGDVKEYFYVDRSAEKLELSKNATYYIPFQKANKISGKISITRQKYIKKGEETLDLTNIKITAYNKQGNSYSSFTLSDGSFTIFVPGKTTYFVRMGNVFGPNFKILQNDILINIGDSAINDVTFNVSEIGRQVKFKEAKPKSAEADSLQQEALKIKVLHGKFYENSNEAAIDKNAVPVFDVKEAPVEEINIVAGNYYAVIGSDSTRTIAVRLKRVADENGLQSNLGYNEAQKKYYIYTKYFPEKSEAKDEVERLQKFGFKESEVIKF